MLLSLLPYIDSDEIIPEKLLLKALQVAGGESFFTSYRPIANTIIPGAGEYLRADVLISLIRADITDENVHRLISDRKKYIQRGVSILPNILRLVGARDVDSIHTALRMIDDCCNDFPTIEQSSNRNKQIRDSNRNIIIMKDTIERLIACIGVSGKYVATEFELHKSALCRTSGSKYLEWTSLDRIREELNNILFAIDVVIYRCSIGDEHFYVGNNRSRTHIVAHAYELALHLGKPQFVTTPGSDFALLCSLIFELASGLSDESLAGAINKFSRSELRQRIDHDEAEFQKMNSDAWIQKREEDNFAHVKEEVKMLLKELDFWQDMANSRIWDSLQTKQLNLRINDIMRQIYDKMHEYGPHLVWTSQISEHDHVQRMAEVQELVARVDKLNIELGRLRRATRSD